MITVAQLQLIMPQDPKRMIDFVPMLNPAMEQYEITTVLREAAFLATVAFESNEFKNLIEIWGPTPAQEGYEGSESLGNTQRGDGYKFRGRGIIQVTGRTNYEAMSKALGVNFTLLPDGLATPLYAIESACVWWKNNGCNELADIPDFRRVTRRVNGGYNGMTSRLRYYNRALTVLNTPDFSDVVAGVGSTA